MPETKPTALVVDDDSAIVSLCATILEHAGFTVLKASGSPEALKLCKNHQGTIDLLVTDLVMPPPGFTLSSESNEFPYVHGHDLAVRALQMRNNLHIILMSGNMDQDLSGYGIRRGSLPFLQKPFDPQTLTSMSKEILQTAPPTVESLSTPKGTRTQDADEWFD